MTSILPVWEGAFLLQNFLVIPKDDSLSLKAPENLEYAPSPWTDICSGCQLDGHKEELGKENRKTNPSKEMGSIIQ